MILHITLDEPLLWGYYVAIFISLSRFLPFILPREKYIRKKIRDVKSELLTKRGQEEYTFWKGFVKGNYVSVETGDGFIDSKIEDLSSFSAFQQNLRFARKLESKIKLCEKILEKIPIGFLLIFIIAVTSILLLIMSQFLPSYLAIFGSIGGFLSFAQVGILLFLWRKFHQILHLEDSDT